MMPGDFHVGEWLVQPSLDRIQRGGCTTHLRPKTMQVLVDLADHVGQVVTRAELSERVWCGVHVTDEALSHCITEIRGALSDDPHRPTYIETVAKHGYWLVAEVRPAEAATAAAPAAEPGPRLLHRWFDRHAPRIGWPIMIGILGIGAMVIGVSVMGAVRWWRSPVPAAAHLIVLADWENRTGDEVFDGPLRQALAVKLGDAPNLRVASRERVAQALQLMRQPSDARLTAQMARQVCQRIGGDIVVEGDIAKIGEQFVLLAEVAQCTSAVPIAQLRAEASGREQVLRALDRIAGDVRRRLGDVPPGPGDALRPVEDVTTSTLEALRAFSLAGDALAGRRAAEALTLYHYAIELDPDFALAHSRLGTTLASLREWKHANEHRGRAMQLAAGLTQRERLYVTAAVKLGQGRAAEAELTLMAWADLYPGDRVPLSWLVVSHLNRGELDRALKWADAAVKVDPTPATLVSLATVYLNTGRVADAKAAVSGLPEPAFAYLLAFLSGDAADMDRQRSAVEAGTIEEFDMRAREAQAAMAAGRLRAARALVGRAETLGLQLGLLELTAQVLATQALWEAEAGDSQLAAEMAVAALSMTDNPTTRALAVLTFACSGATVRARAILNQIETSLGGLDPAIEAGSRRKLNAALLLALNRPKDALEQLSNLRPYEDGGVINHVALRGDVAELGVHHLRGRARLALGQGREAAAEFQTILDRRGVSPLSPYVALAPLNLARALALSGDVAAARRAYETFLERWKAADPDASRVGEARREHARLAAPAAGSAR